MVKNILLGLLLTTLVIQQGFKTKTQLQRLSEGYIDFDEPRTNKKNKDPDDEKTTDKNKDKQINQDNKNWKSKFKNNQQLYSIILTIKAQNPEKINKIWLKIKNHRMINLDLT